MYKNFLATIFLLGVNAEASANAYISGNLAAPALERQIYQEYGAFFPSGSKLRLSTKPGWGLGGGLGWQRAPYRLEAAIAYFHNKIKNGLLLENVGGKTGIRRLPTLSRGKLVATALLVNGYYDFTPEKNWTPYLGLGLGLANVDPQNAAIEVAFASESRAINLRLKNNHSFEFAWQGIVGAALQLNTHIQAQLDYRYLRTATASFNTQHQQIFLPNFSQGDKGSVKSPYVSHRVTAGLAYYFE